MLLRQVWRFISPEVDEGAFHIAKNPISNSKSKHIDARHHFFGDVAISFFLNDGVVGKNQFRFVNEKQIDAGRYPNSLEPSCPPHSSDAPITAAAVYLAAVPLPEHVLPVSRRKHYVKNKGGTRA